MKSVVKRIVTAKRHRLLSVAVPTQEAVKAAARGDGQKYDRFRYRPAPVCGSPSARTPERERVMERDTVYSWENLPEYVAVQQYSRCLGRIFRSLPRRIRRRVIGPLSGAAVLIGHGIVGFNADLPPSERMTAAEREVYRRAALQGLRDSREGLDRLDEVRRVSRPDLLVARELLARIETSVRAAEAPPDWL